METPLTASSPESGQRKLIGKALKPSWHKSWERKVIFSQTSAECAYPVKSRGRIKWPEHGK